MAPETRHSVTVVGAGLAGCEAAWQLAERGCDVTLVDMKPKRRTPAHSEDRMAELVCSNSLRGAGLSSAVGLLKEELRRCGSLLIRIADDTDVPAGRALAVDRAAFSLGVENAIRSHSGIKVVCDQVEAIPPGDVFLATGPLTDGGIAQELARYGAVLAYHDAIAPLVSADGLDMEKVFRASRWEEEGDEGAYLNCPFNKDEYFSFVEALVAAEKTPLHDFEHAPFFEGCLPVEELASRGPQTLSHGPLKPVGLRDPRTGRRPWAVAQLRQEDRAGTAYNLVGFQTRLVRSEQKRVFQMIPGLESARFERYGQVHRNSFVDAPSVLDERLRVLGEPRIRIAGQLSGVEGYVESIAGGFLAAIFFATDVSLPPRSTAMGGLLWHLSGTQGRFQPSNVVWAMIDIPPKKKGEGKRERREAASQIALKDLEVWRAGF